MVSDRLPWILFPTFRETRKLRAGLTVLWSVVVVVRPFECLTATFRVPAPSFDQFCVVKEALSPGATAIDGVTNVCGAPCGPAQESASEYLAAGPCAGVPGRRPQGKGHRVAAPCAQRGNDRGRSLGSIGRSNVEVSGNRTRGARVCSSRHSSECAKADTRPLWVHSHVVDRTLRRAGFHGHPHSASEERVGVLTRARADDGLFVRPRLAEEEYVGSRLVGAREVCKLVALGMPVLESVLRDPSG